MGAVEESIHNRGWTRDSRLRRPQEFVDGLAKSFSANFLPKFDQKSTKSATLSPNSTTRCPIVFSGLPVVNLAQNSPSSSSALSQDKGISSSSSFAPSGFHSSMRIDGLDSSLKGGPAFVGQVFSMLDPSGTGLMAVATHFQIPFLSRVPDWLKMMLPTVFKNERDGPVFRFFMDLGDAVTYVKKLNIPTGMVGACRLDVAYEHLREKPHMFKFIPNKNKVKAANGLLRKMSRKHKKRAVDGVPVFTAQNLSIAIASTEGIKWYKPYFFDKGLLDNILETSIDQHFGTLIRNRHMQRRRDVIDDNFPAEVVDDSIDSLLEPPEVVFLDDGVVVQKDLASLWDIDLKGKVNGAVETCRGEDSWVMSKRFRNYFNFSHPLIASTLDPEECAWAYGMNIFDLHAWRKTGITEVYHHWVKEVHEMLEEMGSPGIPLSVISKAAEIQVFDAVDRMLLGNRWLRKATGIQPKFPYLVDSFEERSAASFLKMTGTAETGIDDQRQINYEGLQTEECHDVANHAGFSFRFPFWDLFSHSMPAELQKQETLGSNMSGPGSNSRHAEEIPSNPLLPKITMVGISTSEPGRLNRSSIKKTMDDLTRELEEASQKLHPLSEENDPLFVANVGDYSSFVKTSST